MNDMNDQSLVWFVTGASRGLGRALVEAALARGDRVVATARTPSAMDELAARGGERLHVLKLDVTQAAEIPAVVTQAAAHFGRLDAVVNNA